MSQETPAPIRTSWVGLGFGLATALIWGTWPVASRHGVEQTLTALDITMLRFLVAGLILLPLVLRRGHGGLGWGRSLLLMIGAGAPYMLLTTLGFTNAPAGHGGLIIPSTMLTCSTLGGWFLLGDRPDGQRLIGLAIVLGGVAVTGMGAAVGLERFPDLWIGHLFFVGCGMCWALYTVTSRKWAVDPLHATALVAVLSLVAMLPFYGVMRGTALLAAPWRELVFQGVMQGIVAAILALVFYTRTVAILGASRAAIFAALVPGFSALIAYPALGEVPGSQHLAGLALVSCGMILALGFGRRRGRAVVP